MRLDRNSVEGCALVAITGYEFAALVSRRLPTVTSLVMRLPVNARRLIVAGVAVWFADHFETR